MKKIGGMYHLGVTILLGRETFFSLTMVLIGHKTDRRTGEMLEVFFLNTIITGMVGNNDNEN